MTEWTWSAAELGTPLQAVALLLFLAVMYEMYITPVTATHPVETWWWGVYVMAAPLLFGGGKPAAVHPLFGLFATRFAIEVLSVATTHWTVAVSGAANAHAATLPPAGAGMIGMPSTRRDWRRRGSNAYVSPVQQWGSPLLPD